jgi:hypothetical protein
VEAVFPPENVRIFSDDFRSVPAGKHRKLAGIHRKKFNKFPVGILLPVPAIFDAFLQDPVSISLLSCRILQDPVSVIFDMGSNMKFPDDFCGSNLTIVFVDYFKNKKYFIFNNEYFLLYYHHVKRSPQ